MTAGSTVVLDPLVRFETVADALTHWEGGALDRTVWLGGEPLAARWLRDGAEVTWSANPAIGLRVLTGSGVDELRGRLSELSLDDAVELSFSADPGSALLGVTALGLLGDVAALPVLAELAQSTEPSVRGAAQLASRRLGLAALAAGADRVGVRRRQHPDRDPVLGLLLPVSVRRQVVRQILAEPPEDRTRLLEVVAAALADDDWEVRWSAVLGAGRHGLDELLLGIRDCSLSGVVGSGTREILEVVRDVVGHRLASSRSSHPGRDRMEHLLDGDDRLRDLPFLLVTSLRTPVPEQPDAPPGLAAVPDVPHWLGAPQHGVRRVRPASFQIACLPERDVPEHELGRRLAVLSQTYGVPLRLPTADELEAATRGPDGRRYPWGNGREPKAGQVPSAWGLAAPLAEPEWVQTTAGPMALPAPRFGFGEPAVPVARAALRPVVGAAVDHR